MSLTPFRTAAQVGAAAVSVHERDPLDFETRLVVLDRELPPLILGSYADDGRCTDQWAAIPELRAHPTLLNPLAAIAGCRSTGQGRPSNSSGEWHQVYGGRFVSVAGG